MEQLDNEMKGRTMSRVRSTSKGKDNKKVTMDGYEMGMSQRKSEALKNTQL